MIEVVIVKDGGDVFAAHKIDAAMAETLLYQLDYPFTGGEIPDDNEEAEERVDALMSDLRTALKYHLGE